jgi:hypothetical protein
MGVPSPLHGDGSRDCLPPRLGQYTKLAQLIGVRRREKLATSVKISPSMQN